MKLCTVALLGLYSLHGSLETQNYKVVIRTKYNLNLFRKEITARGAYSDIYGMYICYYKILPTWLPCMHSRCFFNLNFCIADLRSFQVVIVILVLFLCCAFGFRYVHKWLELGSISYWKLLASTAEGNITVGHRTLTDQLECMTDHCWPWSDTMTVQFFLRWVCTHWYVCTVVGT